MSITDQHVMDRGTSFLAPMMGLSDNPGFVVLCKQHGCDVIVLPMVFTTAASANPSFIARKLSAIVDNPRGINVHPLVLQVIGEIPVGSRVIHDLVASHDIDEVNYNLGCPSQKITRLGMGASLLEDKDRRDAIIDVLIGASPAPVSVKVRLIGKAGEIGTDVSATIDACHALARRGVAWIAVHGRTRAQGYSGNADWDTIKAIHEAISIPVVGNGDITCVAHGQRLVDAGHARAFMIGRAATRDPRVFDRTRDDHASKTMSDVAVLYRELVDTCAGIEPLDLHHARSWAMHFTRGLPGGKHARRLVGRCETVPGIAALLDSLARVPAP